MNHLNHTNVNGADLHSARALLLDDDRVLKRKVRCVAAAGDTDLNAIALYTLAAGHRFRWTPDDWKCVLEKLDDCELTVAAWLKSVGTE